MNIYKFGKPWIVRTASSECGTEDDMRRLLNRKRRLQQTAFCVFLAACLSSYRFFRGGYEMESASAEEFRRLVYWQIHSGVLTAIFWCLLAQCVDRARDLQFLEQLMVKIRQGGEGGVRSLQIGR